ncbi:GNAT family N-acetyltransferase [Pseudovibrio exalbescens]|uniref:GNAT family N-acetyltransferase n=1 Tax=Pseudovibrio exalbescens TaxID=197461 RepID=UPI0023668ADA|nr:GNAT family N-acetyltransferase [Pseudovibrio exalbescens]MDD7908757.1 GNAT family N-acetyltransferase [Pseudovibrio exalbescens]
MPDLDGDIELKQFFDADDLDRILALEAACEAHDGAALKLELDYKRSLASTRPEEDMVTGINEFFYMFEGELIGYLGLCGFGGAAAPVEANGMVHPDYRRKGVFSKLVRLSIQEWRRRGSSKLLMLSDRHSESGQAFLKGFGATYSFSEYEMVLVGTAGFEEQDVASDLTLRIAMAEDADEIARQNAIYFGAARSAQTTAEVRVEEALGFKVDPAQEAKRGMSIFLAEVNGQVVGKINLERSSNPAGIFGLGVLPPHRNKGYGRAILTKGVQKLHELGIQDVLLQVAPDNENALNLYRSVGFQETSTMDYFEYPG